MPDSIQDLEQQRAEILQQMAELGDLRPGSITAIRGRCGKASCHCHRPKDPGHGPNFRLTRKVAGKTVTETFPTVETQRKAEREVRAYHRFRQLSEAFVAVGEKICRLRSVEEPTPSAEEKKRRKPSGRRSHGK